MLRDLSIKNYRSFQEFNVDGLARVNLIVGGNNSGKTSLLEAVYLLVNQNNPQSLINLLNNRGEIFTHKIPDLPRSTLAYRRQYQIKHIFVNHQLNENQSIEFKSHQEQPLSLKIHLSTISNSQRQLNLLEDISQEGENITETDSIPGLQLNFVYNNRESIIVPILDDGSIFDTRFIRTANSPKSLTKLPQCLFITTNNAPYDQLAELWDAINLTPNEEQVVKALKIIEPDVERISFSSRQTSNSGIIIKMRGQNEPIPLGSMGDGMRRILTLAMYAVNVENGFLLVDEIDTGLYYEVQTDMWRLIIETAQRLNIQVFVTTHSWDCVRAFQEALESIEDSSIGKLFRVDSKYGKRRAVEYSPEDLNIAIQQEIEVR